MVHPGRMKGTSGLLSRVYVREGWSVGAVSPAQGGHAGCLRHPADRPYCTVVMNVGELSRLPLGKSASILQNSLAPWGSEARALAGTWYSGDLSPSALATTFRSSVLTLIL